MTTAEAPAACPHLRRRLDTPAGPTVNGTCVACGHVRVFSASGDAQLTSDWNKAQVNATAKSLEVRRKSSIQLARPAEPVRVFAAYEKRTDITDKQREVLDLVRVKGEALTTEIAEALGLETNNAGDRLRALAKRGLLVRELRRSRSQLAHVYKLPEGPS